MTQKHSQWKAVFELKRWRQGKVNARVCNPPPSCSTQIVQMQLSATSAAVGCDLTTTLQRKIQTVTG